MSAISTSIELNDHFSPIMESIIKSVNLTISAIYDMQQGMASGIDTSSIEGAREQIDRTAQAIAELNEMAGRHVEPEQSVPSQPQPSPHAMEPESIEWQTDNMQVFTNSGIERFRQEVQSTNDMLNQLNSTQMEIGQTADTLDLLPDDAMQDIAGMGQRLQALQQQIQQVENNPLNMGTDEANAGLEELRNQLNRAIQAQDDLNEAMWNMDASAANEAYLRLSQTVSGTERYIRDNTNEQGRFNQQIQEGSNHTSDLMNKIKGAVAAYVGIRSVGNVLNMSDELTQNTARLDLMNDGLQTTDELVNKVYAAAQDSRGSFSDMAALVARFGNNAKDAFGSNDEVIAFTDLIQKQMTIAGASTQEAANAELQLSQALGSGVLRGDELNSIFEQAPNLIQNIADYMGKPIGQIRELAKDGEITADIVKAAVFSASDEINQRFEAMPMTWSQVWATMKNTATIAFRPVFQRLNDIANSESFQTFVNGAVEAMATLANIVLNIFELVGTVGGFTVDNWSVISPIVYGVVAALGVYAAYLGIVKAIEIASAVATLAHNVLMSAKIGIMALVSGSTMAATAAQMGYNGALYACPVVWIIMLLIALIAIIFAVCNAIAKMTGVANSGFGVIVGCVYVVGVAFKNLGLVVANIALGIGDAIAALGVNIMVAFHNAICAVQSWWYDLLSTCLSVIENICAALNKLPFVEFDYSGISSAADDYAAKASEAAGNKEEYQSISDAFNEGFTVFDAFQDGWASDAFDKGAAWGDGVADKVSNFSLSDIFGSTDIPDPSEYTQGFDNAAANALNNIADNTGSAADDTSDISESLDITEEDLKYLRDIAEQEAINRYTTAAINIDMSGMQNSINNDNDIDGFITKLTDSVNEAVGNMTEGVHA